MDIIDILSDQIQSSKFYEKNVLGKINSDILGIINGHDLLDEKLTRNLSNLVGQYLFKIYDAYIDLNLPKNKNFNNFFGTFEQSTHVAVPYSFRAYILECAKTAILTTPGFSDSDFVNMYLKYNELIAFKNEVSNREISAQAEANESSSNTSKNGEKVVQIQSAYKSRVKDLKLAVDALELRLNTISNNAETSFAEVTAGASAENAKKLNIIIELFDMLHNEVTMRYYDHRMATQNKIQDDILATNTNQPQERLISSSDEASSVKSSTSSSVKNEDIEKSNNVVKFNRKKFK